MGDFQLVGRGLSHVVAEERYRTLFEAIDQGFCVVEVLFDEQDRPVDYRFIEVNAAFERQTGLKDAAGRRMRELAPLHEDHWFETYGQVAVTGRPVRFVDHAKALNRWFDVYAFPIGPGTSRQVAIVFSDITERRRAQEALRQSEEQLRLVFESATEYAFVVTDPERRIIGWNSGSERLLGYPEQEILGKSADILFTPEDRARHQPENEVRIANETGRATNERWHVRRDGSRFWGSGVMFRLHNGSAPARGFLKIMRDRTVERQVQHDMQQSEERLRLATEISELGTWEYNPIAGTGIIDGRARDLFGIPPEVEPTYDVYLRAVHPDDRQRVHELVNRVLIGEHGGDYRDEYRILRLTDGAERWIRAAGRVHFDREGRASQVIGTVLDISDLMKAREVLARRSEELERIVEDRTRQLRETVQQLEMFSYSLVHDMRAPLRSIRSFARILSDEYGSALDDTAREYLNRLEGSVGRMDSLITDVLAYSRVNSAEATLSPVNLEELVREILDEYPQFHECRTCVHVESPLPVALGNRALLTQCISNLLGNALKFVPPGRKPHVVVRSELIPASTVAAPGSKEPMAERSSAGDAGRLEASPLRGEEAAVRIWFEDNGIGIAPEHRDQVFGLFQRLHRSDQYPGTGVGLAIVQKAVQRMRGSVGFESEPDRGTRFWIILRRP